MTNKGYRTRIENLLWEPLCDGLAQTTGDYHAARHEAEDIINSIIKLFKEKRI